jgi:hypothetical protein
MYRKWSWLTSRPLALALSDAWKLRNTSIRIVGVSAEIRTKNYPKLKKKGKIILVTGRGGLYGCETSRLPHFLNNRLTGGGEVVSLTRRPPFSPRKIPGTHFC